MVTLRPAEVQDVPRLYQFRQDEEVMFWAAGAYGDAMTISYQQLEERIKNERSGQNNRTFVIEVQENGQALVIGTLSFRDFDRINHSVTIGMLIGDKKYWSQGYGTRALQQFVRLLFTRFHLHRLDMDTFADNKRAIRCYEKCGFVVEGVQRQARWTLNGYRDKVLMGLLREDWLAAKGQETYYLE